ncbi:zinc finger, CCHC-type containing protein, partial [Tanacetum coccineum]
MRRKRMDQNSLSSNVLQHLNVHGRYSFGGAPVLLLVVVLALTEFIYEGGVLLIQVASSGGMKRGFLSQKGSGGRRGVKEKDLNRNKKNTPSGIGEGVTPSVVDMTVEMDTQNSLEDTTVPEFFPTLTTPVTSKAGNAPGKSSYANITGKPSAKKVNVRTLFTPRGNGIDVVVSVDSIRGIHGGKYGLVCSMFSSSTGLFSFQFSSMDGLDSMLKNGPWFIQNNTLILKKWHPDENLLKEDVSTVPVWVKRHGVPVTAFNEDGLSAIATKLADVEFKDNIVVAMPKINREGHYTCNVHVEYEWKPPRFSSCKVFGHIHKECPKNTSVVEKKNVKKPSQTSRGVSVGPKMGFKPNKEYRPVIKKSTASSSGNKKKCVKPTIEVSNSNPFDVLNSVDNDGEFGTN